jgi:hypothetical protein
MKRAWILFDDGTSKELHPELIDEERINYPVADMPTNEYYLRHEVVKDTAYVFMRDSEANTDVLPEFADRIRRLIEKRED